MEDRDCKLMQRKKLKIAQSLRKHGQKNNELKFNTARARNGDAYAGEHIIVI